eukprot:TRINITY_DN16604_c0_g1_i1.p1 TRINITY_DN16604_c0_g1~~TRINITY_DN16604_c0_g1_i1.p1  ORF type:complete len:60 (+),score=4.15 TRINITY_DN16604_c0_g1_i1:287-466(+)
MRHRISFGHRRGSKCGLFPAIDSVAILPTFYNTTILCDIIFDCVRGLFSNSITGFGFWN